ncbi:MAG TPA: TonB-dependent receptor, partial [Novosphingobium sp.]|nr:TonB-dependent receptor [Novosphingobium sp.]
LSCAAATPALAHAAGNDTAAADADTDAGADARAILVTGAHRAAVGDAQEETAPAAIATLNAAQLGKLGGLDGAVTGALRLLPGAHIGGGDFSGVSESTLSIRGFSQDQIGVARDGVPLNDPVFLTPHADFAGDPENYDSISVLYGSGSVDVPSFTTSGGSIDIRTVAPEKQAGILFKQGFGSNSLRRTFGRVNTGEYHGFSAWVSGSVTSGHLWTDGGGEIWSRRFEANLQYKWGEENQINVIASDFKMKTNSYFHPTLAQYAAEPYGQGYAQAAYPTGGGTNGVADVGTASANSLNLQRADFPIQTYGLNSRFKLAEGLRLRIDPYYVRVNNGVAAVSATALSEGLIGTDLNGDGDKLDTRPVALGVFPVQHRGGVTARLNWDAAKTNHVELGFWYDHVNSRYQLIAEPIAANGSPVSQTGSAQIYDSQGRPVDFANQHNVIDTHKLWLQDAWDFLPGWNAVATLAWQHSSLDALNGAGIFTGSAYENKASYDRVLPGFALTFQANAANQFYYNLTTNERIPAIAGLYQGGASFTPQKAETTVNQELGWRYATPQLLVSAALFLDYFHNRQVSYQAYSGVTSYFNAGNVTTRGAEVSLNGKLPEHFSYSASWTHVIAKQDADYTLGGATAATAGRQLYNTPKDTLGWGLAYDDSRLYGNISGRYSAGVYGDLANTEKVPGYTTFDLALGYRFDHPAPFFRKVVLSLNLNNLFNKHALDAVYGGSVSANAASSFY